MRKSKIFRPVLLDTLEDRTVLSAGTSSAIATQVQAAAVNTGQQTANTLISDLNNQFNQAFANFANDYRSVMASYFNGVNSGGGATGIDYGTYQQQVTILANGLGQRLTQMLDEVPGGAGQLSTFVQTRLSSTASNSLLSQLTGIPAVGQNNTTQADFATLADRSIASAALSTTNFVNLYDTALGLTIGYLNQYGSQAANDRALSFNANAVDSNGLRFADTISNGITQAFGNFAGDYRTAASGYLNGTNSDPTAFRNTMSTLVNGLSQQIGTLLANVPGGSTILPLYLQTRIASDLNGSLMSSLTNLPAPGSAGVSNDGIIQLGNNAISDALVSSQSFVSLYDAAVGTAASNYFNGGYRFSGTSGAVLNQTPLTGAQLSRAFLRQYRNDPFHIIAGTGNVSGASLGSGTVSAKEYFGGYSPFTTGTGLYGSGNYGTGFGGLGYYSSGFGSPYNYFGYNYSPYMTGFSNFGYGYSPYTTGTGFGTTGYGFGGLGYGGLGYF